MNFISISFVERLIKKIWLNLELLNTLLKENFLEEYKVLQHYLGLKYLSFSSLFTSYHPHDINITTLNVLMGWKYEGETWKYPEYFSIATSTILCTIKYLRTVYWTPGRDHEITRRSSLLSPLFLMSSKASLVGSHVTGLVYWRSPDRIHQ